MRLGFIAAIILISTSVCSAADKTKTVSLTIVQALNLHCALAATKGQDRQPTCGNLETYETIIKEGDREKVVQKRYEYKPGVISAMAKNILVLQPTVESFQKQRQFLQEKIVTIAVQPDAMKQPDEFREWFKQMADYQKQANALGDETREFNLYTLSDAELDTNKNPIPASVLAVINPIRE